MLLAASWAGTSAAQDEVRNFKQPILMVDTEGHHAPVKSLIWRNGFSLISGGEDKVVRVWDFRDGPRLVRSIRPMIWRGPAGTIHAMAYSPVADAEGQHLLAVAGVGVESRRGDITVFRVPGKSATSGGDVLARLMPPSADQPLGHVNSVLTMAFDPTGKVLASAGNDRNVILWDAKTFKPLRPLTGHTAAIRRLAFLPPDGRQLVTISEDGSLRRWDVGQGVELERLSGNPPGILNALAVSPDGQTIVVGFEAGTLGGKLVRVNSQKFTQDVKVLDTQPNQGSVEFLAYHADGRRMVAAIKSDRSDTLDPMALACDLEIREMPLGNVLQRRRVPGLINACAFSADGARLAYSGGMNQAIYVQDMGNWGKAPVELKGEGSTIFDLGFRAKDQAIGFTRSFDRANLPALYDGFDMAQRQSTTVPRDQLQGARKQLNGWTLVGNVTTYQLDAVNADGRRWRVDLDAKREGLWWSSTFIPSGKGHERPTVAIGCQAGVVIYDLETGRRTRMFAGHISPVVSVVPSPDGHWLASSSIDQMVLFYPLDGCDTRPGLGAKFRRRADGSWVVAEVLHKSFAEASGFLADDVVLEAGIQTASRRDYYTTAQQIQDGFLPRVDELAPNDQIALTVRRKPAKPGAGAADQVLSVGTTKRDNPALMLMLDKSREWVLWTPQGYYDTSIAGDTRLLGWHLNPAYDQTKPTDFVPVGTFSKTMNRPDVIERVWATRTLEVAAGPSVPVQQAASEAPPRIAFEARDPGVKPDSRGVWETTRARLRLRITISAAGQAKISDRKVLFDEQLIRPLENIGPGPEHEEDLEIELPPGRRVPLLVTATNDKQLARSEFIELEYHPPKPVTPPVTKPRLIVLSLGTERFPQGRLPDIHFAEQDAEGVAGFLADHLVSSDGSPPDEKHRGKINVLTGEKASTGDVRAEFDRLAKLLHDGQLKRGDIVAVVVASHILAFSPTELPRIALCNTRIDAPVDTAVSAQELSDLFGQLTDYGCRVAVFLDGVHEGELPGAVKSDIWGWVRDLHQKRRVISFVASKEGPAGTPSALLRHGLFALGILKATEGAGAAAAVGDHHASLTLDQFHAAIVEEVRRLSNRQQEAGGYFPKGVLPWTPFVRP
jgi:WD40 repeat protein